MLKRVKVDSIFDEGLCVLTYKNPIVAVVSEQLEPEDIDVIDNKFIYYADGGEFEAYVYYEVTNEAYADCFSNQVGEIYFDSGLPIIWVDKDKVSMDWFEISYHSYKGNCFDRSIRFNDHLKVYNKDELIYHYEPKFINGKLEITETEVK